MQLARMTAAILVTLAAASALLSCARLAEDAATEPGVPTAGTAGPTEASRETVSVIATPTVPPGVATAATTCQGVHRTGREVEQGRMVAATYEDQRWTVEIRGLWEFESPPQLTLTGVPLPEQWRGTEFVDSCTLVLNVRGTPVGPIHATIVTATPPSD